MSDGPVRDGPASDGTASEQPQRAPEPDDGLVWRRVHPITPVVRGWGVILVLLFIFGQNVLPDLVEHGVSVGSYGLWIALGVVVILAVVGGYSALAWRMTRYAIGPESVHLRKGILFREQRQARLDRLQAIDVVQPVLARIFGLAELRLEVAGGADSGVKIGFLKLADSDALRNELLARAAGLELDEDAPVPAAPERRVIEVSPGMLVGSLLRSGALIWFVLVLAGVVLASVLAGSLAPLLSVGFALLGFGAYLVQRFVGEFNFTGAVSPDGIRLRRGLLETRSQTIPPGRVQALRLTQPLLWRRKDWWRVTVNVAGYALTEDSAQSSSVLLPVGDRRAALDATWLVFPDLGVADPVGALGEAMDGVDGSERFVVSPRSARWLDPISRRRNGYAVTGRGLLIRSGRLVRTVVLVPHERTQSLGLAQGPVQRRLGLTSFALHVTPGPISPVVPHLADAEAARLLREQDERARVARNAQGPEQWMRRIEATDVPDAP
ncbi:MAG: PH domain-containing protein, partial [Cellulomonadaceae bacterium]